MAKKRNSRIVKRNQNILRRWDTGSYTQKTLAAMFKMNISAVSMVIVREYQDYKDRQEATAPV